MNSFFGRDELEEIGFKKVGSNVLISKKASFYDTSNIIIGDNVRIDDFCILSGHIELGNYIHIAAYTALYGGKDGIIISDYANLSSRISVYSISDDYSGMTMTNPMIPEQYKNVESAQILIGKHAIVGASCVILPGAVLPEGVAVGCMSLVNKELQPWNIYAGIPCHKIKERSRELELLEQKFANQMRRL